jgi:hypothetical protein
MRKNVYIILTQTNTILGALIHRLTGDEYTHASISLERDLSVMYSFGRKYTFNPFIGCFKRESLNRGVYRRCKALPGRVIELELSPEQYDRVAKRLHEFDLHRKDYHYNYSGLLNGLFNREACHQNRFLCSEFVYYVLQEAGAADFPLPRNLVRPQSFVEYMEGRTLYQGDLKALSLSGAMKTKPAAAALHGGALGSTLPALSYLKVKPD